MLPLPPERVISLHEYRVGAWYPFRDARLRVEDPKTTVAVGAMIAALARHPAAYPEIIVTSSEKGDGIETLRAIIATLQ